MEFFWLSDNDLQDVTFRFGTHQIHFKINMQSWTKFKSLCADQNLKVQDVLCAFIIQKTAKYDGGQKIDNFFDPEYIPTPKIDASEEDQIEWLKRQKLDIIEIQRDKFYRLNIITKGLLGCPNPKEFNLSYKATWQRYK